MLIVVSAEVTGSKLNLKTGIALTAFFNNDEDYDENYKDKMIIIIVHLCLH